MSPNSSCSAYTSRADPLSCTAGEGADRRQSMHERIAERFRAIAPAVDFCSLRFVQQRSEFLSVRQNILQPVSTSEDVGAMITVIEGSGMGYAGTSELTETGLRRAAEHALAWAQRSA